MNEDALKELIEAAKQAQAALSKHWFSDCGGYNNDDAIDADKRLQKAIAPFAGPDWTPET